MSIEDLEIDINKSPQNYTHWFKLCIPKISKFVKKKYDCMLSKYSYYCSCFYFYGIFCMVRS